MFLFISYEDLRKSTIPSTDSLEVFNMRIHKFMTWIVITANMRIENVPDLAYPAPDAITFWCAGTITMNSIQKNFPVEPAFIAG